jgi:hypothetical protein
MLTNKRLIVSLIIALVWIMIFGLMSVNGGPRIDSVIVDRNELGLVKTSAAQVTIKSTRRLDVTSKLDIATDPNLQFDYQILEDRIVLNLQQPLRYAYVYSIELAGIKDSGGRLGHFRFNLQTESPTIFYAKRGNMGAFLSNEDQIVAKDYATDNSQVIYRASKIYDFAVGKSVVAAVESTADTDANALTIIDSKDSYAVPNLPTDIQITKLLSTTKKDIFAFSTFQKTTSKAQLWTYDYDSRNLKEILADNQSIETIEFILAPDGQTLVYQKPDGSAYIDNTLDDKPGRLIGGVVDLVNFNKDGTKLLVRNSEGFAVINSDGSIQSLEADGLSPIEAYMSNMSDFNVLLNVGLNDKLEQTKSIIINNGQDKATIYEAKADEFNINLLKLSANDEFVLSEEAKTPITYDDYEHNSKPQNVYTVVRDLSSGETVLKLDGFGVTFR